MMHDGAVPLLQIGVLLFFLAAFIAIAFWLVRPGARAAARRAAEIPFRDDVPASSPARNIGERP